MNYSDLFCEKYRPRNLDDMVLEPVIRDAFTRYINGKDVLPNLLLRGSPGCGKTTLAKIIKNELGWQTLQLNASEESGVDTMREKIVPFCQTVSIDGNKKLIILEEADGLSSAGGNGSSAQELLKNLIESTSDNCRFILLVNNISKIDAPIKSRMREYLIKPPALPKDQSNIQPGESNDILKLIAKVIKTEGITVPNKEDIFKLINTYYPDIRKMLQVLQQCSCNDKKEFVLVDENDVGAQKIADMVLSVVFRKIDDNGLMALRKNVIENERIFSGDYHSVMKAMFEKIAKHTPATEDGFHKKCTALLKIQDSMYKHTTVLDKEINFFALIVNLVN